MKKLIATSLALVMLFGLNSCGDKSNNSTNSYEVASNGSETTNSKSEDNNKKTVIDPFENVNYTLPESEGLFKNIYPNSLKITFHASESPLGEVATFTYFIESADENQIVIRSRANIDTEEVQKYLDENNFKIDENEKTFIIEVSDLEANLISEDYLKQDDIQKIKSDMLEFIESELKMSNDAENENLNLEFTLEKLYVTFPKAVDINLQTQKSESSIRHYTDNTSFEDVEIYTNEADLEISSSNAGNNRSFGIFKDNNGAYYCVGSDSLTFNKGVLEEGSSYILLTNNSAGLFDIIYDFDSEEEAFLQYLAKSNIDESKYNIVEITLD